LLVRLHTENRAKYYTKIANGVLTDTCPGDFLNMRAHIRQLCKANSSYPLILMHYLHPQPQKT